MTSDRQQRTWATIDLEALLSNLALARERSGGAQVTAVIKANAYGHGMEEIARALSMKSPGADRFAVATMDELVDLNMLGTGVPILLLQGFRDRDELEYLAEAGVEFVLHADYQLALLKRYLQKKSPPRPLKVWLKLNTGMNRLGFEAEEFHQAFDYLRGQESVARVFVMSHLACADAPDDPESSEQTRGQVTQFNQEFEGLDCGVDKRTQRSLAASAGILAWSQTHLEQVRPGIMLYGGSPFNDRNGPELGLKPVMTLKSRLIAIRQVAAGGAIGYGGTHVCDRATSVGVVSIGYGDGYPRSAANGTPVLVGQGQAYHRAKLLGRVSMDMITIDLSACPDAAPGDEVVLWGEGLPADEVAKFAGTISYELFCQVTKRVSFDYD